MSLHLLMIAFLSPTAKHIHLASHGEPYILIKGMLFEGVPPSHLLRCLDVEFANRLFDQTLQQKSNSPKDIYLLTTTNEVAAFFKKNKNTSNVSFHFPKVWGIKKNSKHIFLKRQVNQVMTSGGNISQKHL